MPAISVPIAEAPAPAIRRSLAGWSRRPPLAFTLLACGAILAWRRPDMVFNPQFWAEDGQVFFRHAHEYGVRSLLMPSGGYLQLALRLVAWLAVRFDPSLAPALFCTVAAAGTLYVAALTQSVRMPLTASIGYAIALVAVPDAGEVLLTLTNSQWILAGALLLVLISRDAGTWPEGIHDCVVLVILGLTGPFIIALAPLFAWRALQRRTRFSITLAACAAVGAALQSGVILGGPRETGASGQILPMIFALPGIRIGASLFSGGWVDGTAGVALGTVAGLVTLAAVTALAIRRGAARVERVWLAVILVELVAMTLYRRRSDLPALFGAGERYFFLPQLIVLWLLVAAFVDGTPAVAKAAGMLLLGSVVLNFSRLRVPALPDLDWPAYATRIRNGEAVTVPANPAGWTFDMPICYPLRRTTPADAAAVSAPKLNCATRGVVSPTSPLTLAFALQTGPPRFFLIRAIGPSLSRFGVARPVAHPQITLLRNGAPEPSFYGTRNRQHDARIVSATAQCGAFALNDDSDDAVAVAALRGGDYSIIVSVERDQSAGAVLVELYELAPPAAP